MEYNVTINQKSLVDAGLVEQGFDFADGAILEFLRKFRGMNGAERIEERRVVYVWTAHKKIREELPMLQIKTDRGIKKRMEKLERLGLVIPHSHNQKLKRSYYSLTAFAEGIFNGNPKQSLGTGVPNTWNQSSKHLEPEFQTTWNWSSKDHINHIINTSEHTRAREENPGSSKPEPIHSPNIPDTKPKNLPGPTKPLVEDNTYEEFLNLYQTNSTANLINAFCQVGTRHWAKMMRHLREYIKRTSPRGERSEKPWRKNAVNYLRSKEWLNPLPNASVTHDKIYRPIPGMNYGPVIFEE